MQSETQYLADSGEVQAVHLCRRRGDWELLIYDGFTTGEYWCLTRH